jgi:hypothetical protein
MLDQIKIASPCSADWNKMAGDDRVRFCAECKKNVFNLSAMTRRDAEVLLKETSGNLCARLYRRADGTVLTEDCPVGLSAKIARVKRRVGWAAAAALSFATAWGQEKPAVLSGAVDDPSLAGISNSQVTALNLESRKKTTVTTDRFGKFRFEALDPGHYDVIAKSPGFRDQTEKNITVGPGERKLHLTLQVAITTMGAMLAWVDMDSVMYKAKLPSKLDDASAKPKP